MQLVSLSFEIVRAKTGDQNGEELRRHCPQDFRHTQAMNMIFEEPIGHQNFGAEMRATRNGLLTFPGEMQRQQMAIICFVINNKHFAHETPPPCTGYVAAD